uniref:Uncharacterized protein n=1 Tax=Anguilla anguilla TaxID=7936 RepID=A0A0E9TWD4_ANGAN
MQSLKRNLGSQSTH